MTQNTMNIKNKEEFDREVIGSNIPVLVDFYADWCGPCKQLSPTLDEVSSELSGKVKVVKVNIEDNTEISASFEIKTIPAMILFRNGKVVDRKMGNILKEKIIDWISEYIK